MRNLSRNKTAFYYATFKQKDKVYDSNGDFTGEYTITYNTPVSIKGHISAAKGQADEELFGINTNYSKTIIVDDTTCPIAEDSILWLNAATTAPHDYMVVKVAKSFNHITYAVREVNLSA